ncbi:SUMF1/EgtB/PvdO family nonheme iron enzyme [Verrucomicrobia bacterium]|nr:SUMF1/EgtB/PvdO family nonheme iron enzyme [Verrucomicrobiota bacterium]MDB4458955.1 SUMF1/EgtB/PvdO family nonheme iron enzyme [bacterium]
MPASGSPSHENHSIGASTDALTEGQKVFERYTLMKVIGRGRMSNVWLAWDDNKEHDAVLKFLPDMVKPDPTALANLKREVQKLQDIDNPQIVTPYGVESEGSLVAIASPHVEGTTLSKLREEISAKVFSPPELSDWLVQLCQVLEFAHNEGKVHGDLKPGNLMADQKGRLMITDFGLERHAVAFVKKTSEFANADRDLPYLSPQQATTDSPPAAIDDIYSLGATLYELLTSKSPFYAGNILLQVEQKVPPSMTHRRKEIRVIGEPISRIWEETVAACLSKHPDQRPQTVQELFDMLELERPMTASGEGIDSINPETVPVAAPPKTLSKAIGIVGGLIFLAIALAVFQAGRDGNKDRQADLAYQDAEETSKAADAKLAQANEDAETKRQEAEVDATRIKAEATSLAEKQRKESAAVEKKIAELKALEEKLEADRLAKIEIEKKARSEANTTQNAASRAGLAKAQQERMDAEAAAEKIRKETATLKKNAANELAVQQKKIDEALRRAEVAERSRIAAEKQLADQSKQAKAQMTVMSNERQEKERVRLAILAEEEKKKRDIELARIKEENRRNAEMKRMAAEAELAEKRFNNSKDTWFNSLGLKFIRVGKIHFAVVEVRVADFQAFVTKSGYDAGRDWRNPNFRQDSSHPVVSVSWQDAKAFSDWLSRKEQLEGIITGFHYKLPSDLEWSAAVGLNNETGSSPLMRDSQVKSTYPWGAEFPPIGSPGNYSSLVSYDDYPNTAPVGSFSPNKNGLHDLGGNVWEWTEDWGDSSNKQKVLRGGSWIGYLPASMLSSYRRFIEPSDRKNDQGFRLVLVPDTAK